MFRAEVAGVRFAFYGRISTADHQDHGSSLHWQLAAAKELITGHGRIVAEYFDAGVSRRIAWLDRPHAARPPHSTDLSRHDRAALPVPGITEHRLQNAGAPVRLHGVPLEHDVDPVSRHQPAIGRFSRLPPSCGCRCSLRRTRSECGVPNTSRAACPSGRPATPSRRGGTAGPSAGGANRRCRDQVCRLAGPAVCDGTDDRRGHGVG